MRTVQQYLSPAAWFAPVHSEARLLPAAGVRLKVLEKLNDSQQGRDFAHLLLEK